LEIVKCLAYELEIFPVFPNRLHILLHKVGSYNKCHCKFLAYLKSYDFYMRIPHSLKQFLLFCFAALRNIVGGDMHCLSVRCRGLINCLRTRCRNIADTSVEGHSLQNLKEICLFFPTTLLIQCAHSYFHVHTHTHIYIYTFTYVRMYIYTYIHTYIHTYIQTYIHTYIHTYVRTYVRTYIFSVLRHAQRSSRSTVNKLVSLTHKV